MSERSFIEIWSLAFDDVSSIEGLNQSSRIWVAFQLRFCRLSAEDYRGLTPLI